jgi:hypothetical protein
MSALFVMGNSTSCSLLVSHWETGGWDMMFPPHSNNWTSDPKISALGNPTAFVRALFERSGLALVPQHPLLCTLCAITQSSTVSQTVLSRPLEPGADISFEFAENRAAALVTNYKTYRMDAELLAGFEDYTKSHYKSWVKFARDRRYGNNIDPVLVYGFDMTKEFVMMAYSERRTSLESDLTVTVPTVVSASASFRVTWHTRCSPHVNSGPNPEESIPLPLERAIELPSSQQVQTPNIPNEFNQCVFIRYYTARERKWMPMLPKVIKAGAGPHDLGSGDNEGNSFPELTVQSDADPPSSDDEDLGGQRGPTTDDSGSESDIVVRNTSYV